MTGLKIFAVFAFICTLQAVSAHFDWTEYVGEKIFKTIKDENITCENHIAWCQKKNDEFVDPNDNRTQEVTKVAYDFCKGILEVLLCKKDSQASESESNDVNGPSNPMDTIREKLEEVNPLNL